MSALQAVDINYYAKNSFRKLMFLFRDTDKWNNSYCHVNNCVITV